LRSGSSYKGVHFSKYSSKRSDFTGKKGPGPGDYDIANPIEINVEHYHMKSNLERRPETNIPRYPENLIKTIEKDVRLTALFVLLIY
jgi:hypothetical protein